MRKVAKGRFLRETSEPQKNHLLVSTVTGVAPYVSYIRSLMNDERDGRFRSGNRLFLLNGASRSWEFGYHEELANIAATHFLAQSFTPDSYQTVGLARCC